MLKKYKASLQELVDLGDYEESFVWIEENENILNESIDELSDAVLQYVKTGFRNNSLIKFSDNHTNLDALYRSCIKRNINYQIEEDNKKEMVNNNFFKGTLGETKTLSGQFKGLAYLSYLESIYNLYSREKANRSQWKEFDLWENDEELYKTIDEIKYNNIEINLLKRKLKNKNSEIVDVNKKFEKNCEFFQFTTKNNICNVALSSKGKSFYDYLNNKKKEYSGNEVEDILYAYTDFLLDLIELGIDETKQKEVEKLIENNDIVNKIQPKMRNIIKRKILRTCKRIRNRHKGLQISIEKNEIDKEKYSIICMGGIKDGDYQTAEG